MCYLLQTNSDFDAKPMVMLLGQYSTGKTTFIKHLLKSSYPGELLFSHTFPPCAPVKNSALVYYFLHFEQEHTLDLNLLLTDSLSLWYLLNHYLLPCHSYGLQFFINKQNKIK